MFDSKVLLDQLGGAGFFKMVGTKRGELFMHKDGVTFKIRGCRKYNYINIALCSDDSYMVTFKYIALSGTKNEVFEGIFFDMLNDVIESETGLCTRFPVFV